MDGAINRRLCACTIMTLRACMSDAELSRSTCSDQCVAQWCDALGPRARWFVCAEPAGPRGGECACVQLRACGVRIAAASCQIAAPQTNRADSLDSNRCHFPAVRGAATQPGPPCRPPVAAADISRQTAITLIRMEHGQINRLLVFVLFLCL